MKVKVGQWVRTKDNKLFEVGYADKSADVIVDIKGGGYRFNEIIKVANTPQELIQDGDLVALGHRPNYIKQVQSVGSNLIYFINSRFTLNQVCKILTPNSNGGYDLQWEEEE